MSNNVLYPVTQQPRIIYQDGQIHDADTLYNSGTVTVYVDVYPQDTTNQGYPLNPGGTYPMMEDTFCSVICPSGTGFVQMLGITNVGFFDPVTQGKATATALNAIGVPAIDKQAVLINQTYNINKGSQLTPVLIDISSYSTVYVSVTEVNGASGSVANLRTCAVSFFSDLVKTIEVSSGEYHYWPSGGGFTAALQAKGPTLQIFLQSIAVGVATSAVKITVVASLRAIDADTSEFINAQPVGFVTKDGDTGLWVADNVAWPNGLSATQYPFTYAGPATLSWDFYNGIGAGGVILFINDPDTDQAIYGMNINANATEVVGTQQIILPLQAVTFTLQNNTGAAIGASFSMTMDGAR
jgi:hypothetical protein